MSSDGRGNTSAFPVHQDVVMVGLSKREYFAARAMQGYLSASVTRVGAVEFAVEAADDLIAALEATK